MSATLSLDVLCSPGQRTGNGCIVGAVHGTSKSSLIPLGLRVAQMRFQYRDAALLLHAAEVFVHGGFDTVAMILQNTVSPCSQGAGDVLERGAFRTASSCLASLLSSWSAPKLSRRSMLASTSAASMVAVV